MTSTRLPSDEHRRKRFFGVMKVSWRLFGECDVVGDLNDGFEMMIVIGLGTKKRSVKKRVELKLKELNLILLFLNCLYFYLILITL